MNATAVRDIPSASLRGRVSDEEWQVRIDLAAAYRWRIFMGGQRR